MWRLSARAVGDRYSCVRSCASSACNCGTWSRGTRESARSSAPLADCRATGRTRSPILKSRASSFSLRFARPKAVGNPAYRRLRELLAEADQFANRYFGTEKYAGSSPSTWTEGPRSARKRVDHADELPVDRLLKDFAQAGRSPAQTIDSLALGVEVVRVLAKFDELAKRTRSGAALSG